MPHKTQRRGQTRGQGQTVKCDRCGALLFEHPPEAGTLDGYRLECPSCHQLNVSHDPGAQAKADIEIAGRLFEESGNPTYAWLPLADALRHGVELPASIRDYFIGVSETIHRLTYKKSPPDVSTAIVKALGFYTGKGAGSSFTEWRRVVHETFLASLVWQVYVENRDDQANGKAATHDLTSIFEDAAERHNRDGSGCPCGKTVGRQMTRKAFADRFRQVVPWHLIPEHLLHGEGPLRQISDILR